MNSNVDSDDDMKSSRPVSSHTSSSRSRRFSRPTSSRNKLGSLRIPSRNSISTPPDQNPLSVATTPKVQPQAFFGIKLEEKLEQLKYEIPCHVELEEAPVYIEKEVLPRVLEGIESLLKLVKMGQSPQDPIYFLAQVLTINQHLKPSGSINLKEEILETVEETGGEVDSF
jgi:hypothetical protein